MSGVAQPAVHGLCGRAARGTPCNHASQPSVPGAQLLTLRCLGPMSFPPSPAGGKTSFVHVFSLRLGEALARDKSVFPEELAQVRWGLERQQVRWGTAARRRLDSSLAAAVGRVPFIRLLAHPVRTTAPALQGTFCEEYETRCDACARTWMRPHALDNLL